jgi:hypothetical protein
MRHNAPGLVFAHELVHALLDYGGHWPDPSNLMAPGTVDGLTPYNDFTGRLNLYQISRIRNSPYVH